MQTDFAVLADYALIDQHGKLSVLGIFQHVWVASFPAMHPRTHLVLRVRGRRSDAGEHPLRIRFVDDLGDQLDAAILVDDQGTELIGGEGTVHFAPPPPGVMEIEAGAVLVFDVPFPRPGTYAFEISVDGGPLVRVPLSASQVPQEGVQH